MPWTCHRQYPRNRPVFWTSSARLSVLADRPKSHDQLDAEHIQAFLSYLAADRHCSINTHRTALGTHRLMAQMMYGCGLRVMEVVRRADIMSHRLHQPRYRPAGYLTPNPWPLLKSPHQSNNRTTTSKANGRPRNPG